MADEPNPWRETVRDIFDEMHFGRDSVFKGQKRLAARVVSMIERRHHDFFREGRPMPDPTTRREDGPQEKA